MQKVLKILLVVILGIVGTCSLIWVLSTTASSLQEASSRGETFGAILAVILFAASGAAIFKAIRGKS